MTGRIAKLIPYFLLAPAIFPLVYISGLVYPYVAPKTFLLQGIGIIALAAFAYAAFSGQAFFYGRLRSRFSWIPAALLLVAYATSLLGIDFYRSFWGLFDRGDGLLTLTVITTLFYLTLLSADRAFFDRLIKTVSVVAGAVAIIAVLQWIGALFGAGAAFLPPVSGRIGSTFGNAAFLAGYLGTAFFVILIARRDSTLAWRRVYTAAALLSVFAVLVAATRGTILALFLASFVALVHASWKGGESVRRFSRFSLAGLVLLTVLFFGFRSQLVHAPFEPIRRIASISLSDSTVASRLFVWQRIGAEALERPFLGYGAEHIDQLFDKIYDPSLIIEQWFDRAHNAFLDYFAQYGVFGLALYLAFIGAFAISALRLYRREPPGFANAGVLFFLLILTYAVQNFFVFDTPSSLWLLYALFALLIAQSSDAPASSLRRLSPMIPAFAFAAIALLIIPAVASPLYANFLLTKGYLLHVIDVNRANAYFERGLSLGTYADLEYGYQAYSMYTDHQAVMLSGKERVAAYEYALSVLSANFKKYPYDARTATYLGHVIDTAPPEAQIDDAFDQQVLVRAIELSPLRAQAWYMLANISLRKVNTLPQGDRRGEKYVREAIGILEIYAEKETTLPLPRYTLASLYYKLGDLASAKKWADEAYALYRGPDMAVAKPAVKYYLAIEDWQHARRFLADMVAENPTDDVLLYDLAKVLYLAGDPAGAERIVVQLRVSNPALISTDTNFLNAITAYEQSKR